MVKVLRIPSADCCCRTLFVNNAGLEHAKALVAGYKQGKIGRMNEELWKAKKIVDSTLHPGMFWRIPGFCEGWV
jgi:hypothetical protein